MPLRSNSTSSRSVSSRLRRLTVIEPKTAKNRVQHKPRGAERMDLLERVRSFRYFDKGNLAVVGQGFAVLQSGIVRMSGLLAWLVWALIHLQFLVQPSLRVSVLVQWVWTLCTGQRGSRIIVRHHGG